MGDPLSIVASVVGIIGFGVQVAQILQKEIDEITTATERVEQIVIEVRATATGLANLKEFLLEDATDSDNQIFNNEGRLEVTHIVRHCNTVFRNITVLVAKSGSGVLSQVDLYQRKVEEEHKKRKPTDDIDIDIKLDIELSNIEHLMWPWRLPKIQQYLADMDRLKISLVLILSVANLAKTRRQKTVQAIKAGTSDMETDKWEGSDAETLVQDEIFYQDQGLREAEQKLKSLTVGPSAPDSTTRSRQSAAKLLIQSWPNSPSGRGLCSVTELHDSGVVLESHAFNFDNPNDLIIEMPLNFQTLQQHALRRRHWGSKKPTNVWDTFAGLPIYQQEAISEFISKRKRSLYGRDPTTSSQNSKFVLLSVYRDNFRWRRLFELLKRFLTLDVSGTWGRYILFIVTARVANESDQRGNTLDGESQESGSSYDSTYSSDSYDSRRGSRSRYRRRRARDGNPSRSLLPGERHSMAGAFVRRVKHGVSEVLQRRANDQRRTRSRERNASYADEYYEYDDDYGAADQGYPYDENSHRDKNHRARDEMGTNYTPPPEAYSPSTYPPGSYPPESYQPRPYSPGPPQRTKTNKTTRSDSDGHTFRRVETLIENDNELKPPSRRATQDGRARNEPVVVFPPSRRKTTTFKPDAEEIPDHANSGAANPPANAKTRSGLGKSSEVPEPGLSRRDTTKVSSRGWGLIHRSRTARSRGRSRSRSSSRSRSPRRRDVGRRRRSRSRSRSRSIGRSRRLPFLNLSTRNRSRRSDYESQSPSIYRVSRRSRRSRRSQREASSGMQLLTSSPSRPIIRTFEEDGIPPTQRDKAAVAEYYLRKWTTAYERTRGETMSRPRQPQSKSLEPTRSRSRSRSRSRTIRRESYTRNAPGLIEYGSDPLYVDNDATAGGSDYYPYTPYFPPPPVTSHDENLHYKRKQQENASGKGKDAQVEAARSDPGEGDPTVGTGKSSADVNMESQNPSRVEEVGEKNEAGVEKDEHNDRPETLEIPRTDQRAYAESVPDLETEDTNSDERRGIDGP